MYSMYSSSSKYSSRVESTASGCELNASAPLPGLTATGWMSLASPDSSSARL